VKKRKTSPSRKKSDSGKLSKVKLIAILVLTLFLFLSYQITLSPNLSIKSEKYYIYIPSHCSLKQLSGILEEKKIILNSLSFELMAGWMDYSPVKKEGLYLIKKDWSNYQLINHLKEDKPVSSKEVSLPPVRNRNNVIRTLSEAFNLDKKEFKRLLQDTVYLKQFKEFDLESIYCIFIPGTYRIKKNNSEKEIIDRMYIEYLNFWNDERLEQAEDAGLTPVEAIILSSIVYAETKNEEEMPFIAGVYINRLKKNMRLESDPTLIYATGDFNTKRVYKNKKNLYPNYNTYRKKGLPPGPIYLPPIKATEAVLNYAKHDYIYFCAKGDSTGCHSFAATFEEHKENADTYRRYLDSRKIF
jgi:UPF0755 protein